MLAQKYKLRYLPIYVKNYVIYYVVINAKGADGINYEIRRDVNLMRGYTEDVTGNNW